ncbi:MAG: winged helix-turn-helix transcriptional regulator [Nanoarchaeota archaeon]|nr:winged helix-turn-helix transcriptional regulator [Nanoarchaeota archaeon]
MLESLDKIDKRILFELDKNARIADTRLAKLVGRSKESVRYRIKKLQEDGVIKGFTTWIDPCKLGFLAGKIYLQLANRPEEKKAFVEHVKKDKRLFWLGIAEGAWNAGLTYFVKSNNDLFELKNALFSKFKELILESRTGVLVNVASHDITFFFETQTEWKNMFYSIERYDLEPIENAILKELFLNSRESVVEIARKHKSTVDIVRNRMRKLEEKGIIFRYLARIDYNKLGYEFYKTFLYTRNLTQEDERRFLEYTRQQPKIIHLVKLISPWDFELEIMCESYQEYNKIISDLTKEFANVFSKVETAIMGEDYVFPAKEMVFE